MAKPVGAHNPKIAAVRELLHRKGRHDQRRFIIEGPTLVAEALASGLVLHEAYATEAAQRAYAEAAALERTVPLHTVDERTFGRISDLETPTGLLAVAELPERSIADFFVEPGLVLILASINDPGNAGTLVRSAEAFGIDRVLFGSGGVEPFHPKVVRASMGSMFRVRIATARAEAVAPLLDGWTLLGLAAGGESIDQVPAPSRTALVVGHERHGLGEWAPLCSLTVGIPMRGPTESLNAAMAGSIAMYEVSKRLQNGGG